MPCAGSEEKTEAGVKKILAIMSSHLSMLYLRALLCVGAFALLAGFLVGLLISIIRSYFERD